MKKIASLLIFLFLIVGNTSAQWNGYSTYTWSHGDRFEGHWVNGVIDGTGIYYWPNGIRFIGHWKNGKRWGHGIEIYADGTYYVRYFENDVSKTRTIANPKKLNTGIGIYKGEMVDGRACGKGTFYWSSGQYFEGTWTADGKSRYGILYHNKTATPYYVGNWTNEQFDGYGCIISDNGKITVGFWQNGVYQYKTLFR